jgi:tetratricopeptide (TPR) repeat protein
MVHKLAVIAELRHQDEDAVGFYEESLAFARNLGLDEVVAVMLLQLARVVDRRGDRDRSQALSDEGRSLLTDLTSVDIHAGSAQQGRHIARRRSDLARARGLLDECLAWYRQADDRDGEAFSLSCLGTLAELAEDVAEAVRVYREVLRVSATSERWPEVAAALERLSVVAVALGAPRDAAILAGAAAGLRHRRCLPPGPSHDSDEPGMERPEFAAAFERARELTDAEAVAAGLASDLG